MDCGWEQCIFNQHGVACENSETSFPKGLRPIASTFELLRLSRGFALHYCQATPLSRELVEDLLRDNGCSGALRSRKDEVARMPIGSKDLLGLRDSKTRVFRPGPPLYLPPR